MNSTNHRVLQQKGREEVFIQLQPWNTKLLLQAGPRYLNPGGNSQPVRRTPPMRLP